MSKKNTVYLSSSLLLLLVLVMPACDWFKPKSEAAEVKQETQEPKLRLLDADAADVYSDAHIPGSINVSAENIASLSEKWNKETPVVVYCSGYGCGTSHQIAKTLVDNGFKNVSVFPGGINEWHKLSKENKEAYGIEGEAKSEFLQKVIEKVAPKEEEGIRIVSAEELSKMIAESKKA